MQIFKNHRNACWGNSYITCLTAAFATILMGLYANLPFALASGMGLNAFFAFTVVNPQV